MHLALMFLQVCLAIEGCTTNLTLVLVLRHGMFSFPLKYTRSLLLTFAVLGTYANMNQGRSLFLTPLDERCYHPLYIRMDRTWREALSCKSMESMPARLVEVTPKG